VGADFGRVAETADGAEAGRIADGDDCAARGNGEADLFEGAHRVGGGVEFEVAGGEDIVGGEPQSCSKRFGHVFALTLAEDRRDVGLDDAGANVTVLGSQMLGEECRCARKKVLRANE